MNTPRFSNSQWRDAEPPPMPSSRLNRIQIEIVWDETPARANKIRHHHIEAITKARFIRLKRSRWQDPGARLALDAEIQKIFASKPGSRAI